MKSKNFSNVLINNKLNQFNFKSMKAINLMSVFVLTIVLFFSVSCSDEQSFVSIETNQVSQTQATIPTETNTIMYKAKAVFCQCLQYIRNYTQLPAGSSVAADQYGTVLKQKGYSKKSIPSNGNLVIFKKGYGSGINSTYGHIGRIVEVSYDSKKVAYSIKIVSANWSGKSTYTDCGCNNVEKSAWIIVDSNTKKNNIEYWGK